MLSYIYQIVYSYKFIRYIYFFYTRVVSNS